jgi:hypothetical protein
MRWMRTRSGSGTLCLVFTAIVFVACGRSDDAGAGTATVAPASGQTVPQSLPMGGKKSVTTFFVTSTGPGMGGNLGGLTGADAHCQALAKAEGSGDHTWHAYLSASATDGQPAVNARDRIGSGPWYNAAGILIAANVAGLHGDAAQINKETAVTERLDPLNGVGDTPNVHDILTGSRPDGTAFPASDDLTCRNWTSSGEGRAQVGHHDRRGLGEGVNSWNSVHASQGCSPQSLQATGGAGLIYCFGVD